MIMSTKQRWINAVNPGEMIIENKMQIYSMVTEQMDIKYKGKKWKFRDSEDNNGRTFYVWNKKDKQWVEGGWLPEHQEMFNNLINYEFEIHS